VCIRCFWQGNHHIYSHIWCIYTVLANPAVNGADLGDSAYLLLPALHGADFGDQLISCCQQDGADLELQRTKFYNHLRFLVLVRDSLVPDLCRDDTVRSAVLLSETPSF
jgi:hypothetical protein